MKAYWQLTLAQLRIFARNRQVLFFTLLFPIILMLALGSFLGNSGGTSISIAVIDHDESSASKALLSNFQKNEAIQLDQSNSVDEALDELKTDDYQVVMEIPKGYGKHLQTHAEKSKALDLPVYYNETNASASQLGLTVVTSAVDQVSKNIEDYSPVVAVQPKGVRALDIGYIDFLVPGIVAMMIMNNNMNGVAGQISAWRERGILRRMQGTRLKASTFIAAQITARVLLNGLQAILVLVVASLLFNVQVNGSWLALLTFVVLGTLAFMAIGFIIAGLAKNPESAGPIAAFASFPMLFLGGVFFSINSMPEYLQPFVHVLPISHLSTALRETMNVGTPFLGLWPHWLTLVAWLAVAFTIASRTFKWE
ncbi:ABC transporter permease [Halobacillus halophilus]|uniref:ABC-type transport system permease protein n=1 Tax=Halobacillus halophilus (strain ATCC 35676 / DSM 2266 / JCM 20832 / KCTC 3685 / LMG 17431 / NBRC 102448 / NCIMB 2269) TaxID=866895 RepID=I0JKW1_HALH3|nr:ABC transporter permease [Halobacillus halophilus]ASF38907.1 ABC transporter permease [Halobacillus halophilus]CCG44781.1 ABC-type transport system permease protein [Halobacillus halophilus DSM 2266]